MAETTIASPLKRHREAEQETVAEEQTKRQKPTTSSSSSSSYNEIICFLEDEEEQHDSHHDLASYVTSLQQEISSDDKTGVVSEPTNSDDTVNITLFSSCSSPSSSSSCVAKEEGDKERVMRHLLEASDDELGIPSTDFGGSNYETTTYDANQDYVNENRLLDGFGDALWELEDEAANYYTWLQSELFMYNSEG